MLDIRTNQMRSAFQLQLLHLQLCDSSDRIKYSQTVLLCLAGPRWTDRRQLENHAQVQLHINSSRPQLYPIQLFSIDWIAYCPGSLQGIFRRRWTLIFNYIWQECHRIRPIDDFLHNHIKRKYFSVDLWTRCHGSNGKKYRHNVSGSCYFAPSSILPRFLRT